MTAPTAHLPAPMKPGPVVYTDGQLVHVLVRLALGEPTLSRRLFDQRRRDTDPSSSLYTHRFDSWNHALELAGLATFEQPLQLQGAATKWNQEQLVDALRRCLQETGATALVAYEAWRTDPADLKSDVPPASTIRFRMGSWSRATALACG
ncbi:homing endonuclease associated repeat-containing protein [Streptomyces sp. NPDC055036]